MSNGTAWRGKIIEIHSIPEADKIESAVAVCGVGGRWVGVISKGSFIVGDECDVFVHDALLPEKPEYEFMRQRKFRVKIATMRGARSECLIMPASVPASIGDDISEQLGVLKHERPLDASIGGSRRGDFPSFLIKTDETNIQSAYWMLEYLKDMPIQATIKHDGTSCTAYKYNGEFGVCSRNMILQPGSSVYWLMAMQYGLQDKLPDNTAVQFEIIGPKIQGNPEGLTSYEGRLFDVLNIIEGHAHREIECQVEPMAELLDMPQAERVEIGWLDLSAEDLGTSLLQLATNMKYRNGAKAECIVVRPYKQNLTVPHRGYNTRLSLKVINPTYKGG